MRTGVCVGCKKTRRLVRRGRCEQCAPSADRARARVRGATEPWSRVYTTSAWKRARARVKRRDGFQCRVIEGGERCTVTKDLEVHHQPSLRQLWARVDGEWDAFVSIATDDRVLITVCPSHNRRLDARSRAAASDF